MAASPINYVSDKMCPVLIMHGEEDNSVPVGIGETFYDRIVEKGIGDRTDLYILAHAGHGSPEFYQDSTQKILGKFWDVFRRGRNKMKQ